MLCARGWGVQVASYDAPLGVDGCFRRAGEPGVVGGLVRVRRIRAPGCRHVSDAGLAGAAGQS